MLTEQVASTGINKQLFSLNKILKHFEPPSDQVKLSTYLKYGITEYSMYSIYIDFRKMSALAHWMMT